jgi:hypothetical protein
MRLAFLDSEVFMLGVLSMDGRWVMRAVRKYCWRLWLAGFLVSGTCFAQSWGSVGFGYDYLLTKGTTGSWTSTNGWYVLPTFNINKNIGVYADFTNFYSNGQNIHGATFGPFHAFENRTRYTPFVFVGIGNIRASKAGTVTNSFAWLAGGGLLIRLNRWISFETIPVEYVMNTANGSIGNNFVARGGFAITIPKTTDDSRH